MTKLLLPIKYCAIIVAIFSQSQVFALETEIASSLQDKNNSKIYGMDKRVKTLGALLLVFAPLGLMAYKKNKEVAQSKDHKINILEKRSLDQNSSILLVEVQGANLLLSKTPNGVSLIKEISNISNQSESDEKQASTSKNVSLVANQS